MGEPADPEVARLLAAARAEFAGRLVAKADELSSLAGRGLWADLRVAAHKLRGSCATYGLASAGSLAGHVEETLLASACQPGEDEQTRIAAAIGEFAAEAKLASGRRT